MRIGFDLRPAQKKNSRRRGVGKYTFQLAQTLIRLNLDREFCFYSNRSRDSLPEGAYQVRTVPGLKRPSRLNWLLDLAWLPARIQLDKLDLFHATDYTSIPLPSSCRVWATVHDLIPHVFWEETVRRVPRDYRLALEWALQRVKRVDLILTDSRHSRSDLFQLAGVAPERVRVVYPGPNPEVTPVDRHSAVQLLESRYSIKEPFVFYVGGTDFRKNLPRLIDAFAQIVRRGYRGLLVLGGETFQWEIPEVVEIWERIRKQGLSSRVRMPGYIPDEHLGSFYSACDLFVFPSLYEGFGLPVLEALKCGAVVLSSNRSSLPEVGGDAAVYFDPLDPGELSDSFFALYEDPGKREELRAKGLRRAAGFQWDAAGRAIHRLYGEGVRR